MRLIIGLCLCVFAFTSQAQLIHPLEHWELSPFKTTNELRAITTANGLSVVVGQSGTILTSQDGWNWAKQNSEVPEDLNAITFFKGKFVAGGSNGRIITSTNGTNWTLGSIHFRADLLGIGHNASSLIAVGVSGVIVKSSDGIIWTSRKSSTTNSLSKIAYGAGAFVVVGNNAVLVSSIDAGETWAVRVAGGEYQYFSGVAFGNGGFVVPETEYCPRCDELPTSFLFTSTNGIDWKRNQFFPSCPFQGSSECFTNGLSPFTGWFSPVIFDAGIFLTVGAEGYANRPVPLFTSQNAEGRWDSYLSDQNPYLSSARFGFDGQRFIALSSWYGIYRSNPVLHLQLKSTPTNREVQLFGLNGKYDIQAKSTLTSTSAWTTLGNATVISNSGSFLMNRTRQTTGFLRAVSKSE